MTLQLITAELRAHARRFIAVGLAVLLAVAFLTATLLLNSSTQASLGASIGESYRNASLIVVPEASDGEQAPLPEEATTALSSIDTVTEAYAQRTGIAEAEANGTPFSVQVRNAPPAALDTSILDSGSRAGGRGVTVDVVTAKIQRIAVGDSLTLSTSPGEPARELVVSGITASSNDPSSSSMPSVIVPEDIFAELLPEIPVTEIQLRAVDGASVEALRTEAQRTLDGIGAGSAALRTAPEQVNERIKSFVGGTEQLTMILLVFVGIALIVAALVVSNTFSVLIAQRTRELALLRCLGATPQQLRASVLGEALVMGLISSVLGAAAAIGLLAGIIGWMQAQPDTSYATLGIPWPLVGVAVLVGVLMTVIAALAPARAATSVAPLAALRPQDETGAGAPGLRARTVLGVLSLLLGVPALLIGAFGSLKELGLLIAAAGGAVTFFGILLLAVRFFPPLVSASAVVARGTGVPGRLAKLNSIRNPRRTTATAVALLIGVTLISLMMTGAETSRTAFDRRLAQDYPVDLSLSSNTGEAFDAADLSVVKRTEGVKAAVLAPSVGLIESDGFLLSVLALSPTDATSVLRDESMQVVPGKILMPQTSTVSSVTLTGTKGTMTLEAVTTKASFQPLISTEDAERIGVIVSPDSETSSSEAVAPRGELWVMLDDAEGSDSLREIQTTLSRQLDVPESSFGGAAMQRMAFTQVIDMLLMVVTGLLAVAVVIALIGVANTLSLSVLERTRENSLLRALGLTRSQLRATLAWEAVLVAAVAAITGIVLGGLFGWLGAQAALGGFTTVTPEIPWFQLLAVLGIAVLAGLVASIIPARRATRLSPVEGLATL